MADLLQKLDLKSQMEMVVLNTPPGLERELAAPIGVQVVRDAALVDALDFALVFVKAWREVEAAAADRTGNARAGS